MRLCKIFFQAACLSFFLLPELLYADPHNALQWADSWCWMNASLQCLASIDPLYNALQESQLKVFQGYLKSPGQTKDEETKDMEQTLEYRLWKVIDQIRYGTTGDTSPEVLSKILKLEVSEKMHKKLVEKFSGSGDFASFKGDAPSFVEKLFEALFSSGKPFAHCAEIFRIHQEYGEKCFVMPLISGTVSPDPFKDFLQKSDTKLSEFVIFSIPGQTLSFEKYPPPLFETNKTINGQERIYELFAAVLGNRVHATAVVKDDDTALNKWYFYNDHPKAMVIDISDTNFLTTYQAFGYMPELLFFRAKVEAKTPLQKKLENLGQKLVTLRTQLQSLRDNLKTLQQKIRSKG